MYTYHISVCLGLSWLPPNWQSSHQDSWPSLRSADPDTLTLLSSKRCKSCGDWETAQTQWIIFFFGGGKSKLNQEQSRPLMWVLSWSTVHFKGTKPERSSFDTFILWLFRIAQVAAGQVEIFKLWWLWKQLSMCAVWLHLHDMLVGFVWDILDYEASFPRWTLLLQFSTLRLPS